MMRVDDFVKEMRKIPGLEGLMPDIHGVYTLRINHVHLVHFSESVDKNDLYLYASLYHLPTGVDQKAKLYERLLRANFFCQETGNSWFACDPHRHEILLMTRIPLFYLSKDHFSKELECFVSSLSHSVDWINDFLQKVRVTEREFHEPKHTHLKA